MVMGRDRKDDKTLDLLSWKPEPIELPCPDPRDIQIHSLSSRFARAISKALKECGRSREEIAQEMSDYLSEDFSKNMLDAYASEARENHKINLHRFAALIHATGDTSLLTLLPNAFDFAVIDRKYLPLCERVIRRVQMKRKRAEMDAEIEALDREIEEVEL